MDIHNDVDIDSEALNYTSNIDSEVLNSKFEKPLYKKIFVLFSIIILLLFGSLLYINKFTKNYNSKINNIINLPIININNNNNNIEPYQTKRYLYISRHVGTTGDFKYIAEKLNLIDVHYFNTLNFMDFYISEDQYQEFEKDGLLNHFCNSYDAIFISDNLAEAWPFFKGENIVCDSTIIFIVTNRYDIGIRTEDLNDFTIDFNRTINRNDSKRSRIISNNIFEYPYMQYHGISIPDDAPMVRSFGHSNFEPIEIPQIDKYPDCIILGRTTQEQILLAGLIKSETNYECKSFTSKYGGPKSLKQYESIIIHLPYQVSTMKMWENAIEGIITAIPTPRFFDNICTENICKETSHVFKTKDVLNKDDWWKYVEFYLDEFSDCFIQFDSWNELDTLLTERSYLENVDICKKKILALEPSKIQGWKDFFKTLQFE